MGVTSGRSPAAVVAPFSPFRLHDVGTGDDVEIGGLEAGFHRQGRDRPAIDIVPGVGGGQIGHADAAFHRPMLDIALHREEHAGTLAAQDAPDAP